MGGGTVDRRLLGAVPRGCGPRPDPTPTKAKEEAEAARAEAAALLSELATAKADLAAARAEVESLKNSADTKQARQVAEGFLTALTVPSVDQLHGFCTPAQQKRAATITLPPGKVAWAIASEVVGASGRDATLKGKFTVADVIQPFVVLVAKTGETGRERWLVDGFSVGR